MGGVEGGVTDRHGRGRKGYGHTWEGQQTDMGGVRRGNGQTWEGLQTDMGGVEGGVTDTGRGDEHGRNNRHWWGRRGYWVDKVHNAVGAKVLKLTEDYGLQSSLS